MGPLSKEVVSVLFDLNQTNKYQIDNPERISVDKFPLAISSVIPILVTFPNMRLKNQSGNRMREQTKYLKWITPKTLKRLHHRAEDRANAGRWDLDIAVFLFGVLCIVIILLFQGVGTLIVTAVAVFGLSMVWLCGFRKARLLYKRYYDEELFEQSDEWKDLYKALKITPSAKPEIIIEAYNRLTKAYREALSSAEKRLPLHSMLLRECDEAYQILSDPTIKSAYDHIYWLRYNAEKDEAENTY